MKSRGTGTLKAWAQELGLNEAVRLFDQTLEEERRHAALAKIAEPRSISKRKRPRSSR
jgi:ferritin-like metal-binding protein YciE